MRLKSLVLSVIGIIVLCFSNTVFAKKTKVDSTLEDYITSYTSTTLVGNDVVQETVSDFQVTEGNFYQSPFVLWDYANFVTQESSTGSNHFSDLNQFIKENNIKTLITYIKEPAIYEFYSSFDQTVNHFIYWTQQIKQFSPNCKIYVLFDDASFTTGYSYPTPPVTSLPSPYSTLPSNFLIANGMYWVELSIQNGAKIDGVVIDPEGANYVNDLPTQVHDTYQTLFNFMDYYKTQRNLNIDLGATLGVDESRFTSLQVWSFPVSANQESQIGLALSPGYYPASLASNWCVSWRPNTTYPILNGGVFIQVYEPDMPYIFTLSQYPSLAASYLLHNFRDEPYLLGTGQISLTLGSNLMQGNGTQFNGQTSECNSGPTPVSNTLNQLQDGTKIGLEQFVALHTVKGVTDDDTATIYGNASSNVINQFFFQTEIINNWPQIPYTPDMINLVCFMFSFEGRTAAEQCDFYNYFGSNSWTISGFMSFLNSFYSLGQSVFPIFSDNGLDRQPLPLSYNFGIYDYNIFIPCSGLNVQNR